MESDSNISLETLSETDSRDTTSESQINGSQISNSTQSTANHVINEKEQVSQATDVVNLTTPVENQQAQLDKSTKQNISVENSKNIDHLLDEVNIAKPKSVTTVLKRYASSFAPRTAAINLAAVSTTNTSGQTTYTFTKEDLLGTSVAINRRNVTNPESYNLINNITAVYNPSTGVISWTITTKSPSWFGNYRDAENVYTNLNIATDSRTGLGNPTNVKVNGQNALVTTWEQAKPYNGTDYLVTFQEKDYLFHHDFDFIAFALNILNVNTDKVIYNSLGVPFATIYYHQIGDENILVWQETINDTLPGNMQMILNHQTNTQTIACVDSTNTQKIRALSQSGADYATDLGYLYQFEGNTKDKLANNDAVILTNSDQIIGLDLLAKNLPNLTIHVASVTEMSPKLLSFEQFSNISLYPNANIATIKQLMERASWYLDVNRGNELLNAVREAFNYQLITVSFTETYHNAKFTNDQLIIDANQIDELCQVIQTAQDNLEFKAALLAEQKIQAHQTTVERYRDVFNNSEEDNHVRY